MNITVNKKDDNKEINKLLSKEIICPECKENSFLNIKDFNINLFGCKKNHKINNLSLYKFEDSQKLDNSNNSCSQCKINNISSEEFFVCYTCNKKICSKCRENHDNNHEVIKYNDRNFICKSHNKKFKKYCKSCNEDLCVECENKHINHKIFDLGTILLNKNELYLLIMT